MTMSSGFGAAPDSDTYTEPAGSRFWKMLQEDQDAERLERFFWDVFTFAENLGPAVLKTGKPERSLYPFYRQGMMGGYIRVGEKQVVLQDNIPIDISAMQVNKEFRSAGSRLIYGTNMFEFLDPQVCLWWLKHIGSLNLSNVRNLIVAARSGWPHITLSQRCSLDLSQEELWHSTLYWLKDRHQLTSMGLNFNNFDDIELASGRNQDLREELRMYREKLRSTIHAFRGLKHVVIGDDFGELIRDNEELHNLRLLMTQSRATAAPKPKPQKETVTQFMARRKRERAQEALHLRQQEERERMAASASQQGGSNNRGKNFGTYSQRRRPRGNANRWDFDDDGDTQMS
jgi:hypothetical protein